MLNMAVKRKVMAGSGLVVFVLIIGMICPQAVYAERKVLRGAAGGALKGAAIGELSGGDSGKGAAWGAAAGAAQGIANKKREEEQAAAAEEKAKQDARIRELELQQAYEKGQRDAASPKDTSIPEE